jgi:hypothetical protein
MFEKNIEVIFFLQENIIQMLDGIYVETEFETDTYRIVRRTEYKSGLIVYQNYFIVDKPSNLSEEFKEKLKEYE